MWFLLKAAFWLGVVVVLLPTPEDSRVVTHNGQPVDGIEAIGAAREFVSDMGSFCDRNREACDTGVAAAQQFGVKAQHGARMLYNYLGDLTGDQGAPLSVSSTQSGAAIPMDPAKPQAFEPGTRPSAAQAQGTLIQRDFTDQPVNAGTAVRHVQTIQIKPPVASQHGQPVPTITHGISSQATTPWQADPIGAMANPAWRAPVSRSELAQSADYPVGQSAYGIGDLIQQVQ